MKIDYNIIKSYNPCADRFDNFTRHYPCYEGTYENFIDLKNISYDDKIWVSRRFLNANQLVHFAVLCAESVLGIYEAKYPDDTRVRDLLTFMKKLPDFSSLTAENRNTLIELRAATYAAANAANAAYAAAYAAVNAADAAVNAAVYAAVNAVYAAVNAADAAADAAVDAADAAVNAAVDDQRALNLEFLKIVSTL